MDDNPEWLLISYCSGRAGREGPGKCFRLYPENEFDKLEDSTTPEIKRCNLSNVILQLKALGVDDIIGFDFMEKPSRWTKYSSYLGFYCFSSILSFFFNQLPIQEQEMCLKVCYYTFGQGINYQITGTVVFARCFNGWL